MAPGKIDSRGDRDKTEREDDLMVWRPGAGNAQ